MLFVLELDAIALLDAVAECQQKAIVPFLMLMPLVKGAGKNVILLTDTIIKYHFLRQEYAKSHQYLVCVDGMFSISSLPS